MLKELKYFFYAFIVLGFLAFTVNYYFSDKNKKISYRSVELFDSKIVNYSNNLVNLESDTNNIVEYSENNLNTNKRKYKFWELFFDDEK